MNGKRRVWQVQDWESHVFMLLIVVPVLGGGLWLVHPFLGLVVVAVFAAWVVDNVRESKRLQERGRHGGTS